MPLDFKIRCRLPHYVYTLNDPRDGKPHYVGCCTNMRKRLVSHTGRGRLKCLDSWLNELASLGMKPTIEIVAECNGYFDGMDRERIEIARYVEMHGDLILNRHHRIHVSVWLAEVRREKDKRRAARIEQREIRRAARELLSPTRIGTPT